jgi:hypothetical protein
MGPNYDLPWPDNSTSNPSSNSPAQVSIVVVGTAYFFRRYCIALRERVDCRAVFKYDPEIMSYSCASSLGRVMCSRPSSHISTARSYPTLNIFHSNTSRSIPIRAFINFLNELLKLSLSFSLLSLPVVELRSAGKLDHINSWFWRMVVLEKQRC